MIKLMLKILLTVILITLLSSCSSHIQDKSSADWIESYIRYRWGLEQESYER